MGSRLARGPCPSRTTWRNHPRRPGHAGWLTDLRGRRGRGGRDLETRDSRVIRIDFCWTASSILQTGQGKRRARDGPPHARAAESYVKDSEGVWIELLD